MHGWGEYVLADDSRYEGSWIEGLKSGIGMMMMTSGEKVRRSESRSMSREEYHISSTSP